MMKKVPFALFLGCCLLGTPVFAEPASQLGWLAFGDLRGHLEPCGCDPKTDMGGVRRIAAVLKRERSLNPDLLLFDLGNNLPAKDANGNLNGVDALNLPFIVGGIKALKPTASLFNQLEMQNAPGNIPYVLTSGLGHTMLKNVARERVGKSYVIYGIVTKGTDHSEINAKEFQDFMRKSFARNKTKTKVLLFSGDDSALDGALKSFPFDIVISSNKAPLSVEPGKDENENPKLLERSVGDKVVLMTPLGGQGLVRGGKLLTKSAPSLEQILNSSKEVSLSPAGTPVTWLTKDVDAEDVLSSFFARYRNAQKKQFEQHASSRIALLEKTPFAGAEKCKTCHLSAYNVWKQSGHVHAFEVLKLKHADLRSECAACHSVGFEVPGGFVDEKHSAWLAGVQCENCHGPRKDHVMNPTIKSHIDPKAACVSCHHNPHSSSFEFATYWEKIKHGR